MRLWTNLLLWKQLFADDRFRRRSRRYSSFLPSPPSSALSSSLQNGLLSFPLKSLRAAELAIVVPFFDANICCVSLHRNPNAHLLNTESKPPGIPITKFSLFGSLLAVVLTVRDTVSSIHLSPSSVLVIYAKTTDRYYCRSVIRNLLQEAFLPRPLLALLPLIGGIFCLRHRRHRTPDVTSQTTFSQLTGSSIIIGLASLIIFSRVATDR